MSKSCVRVLFVVICANLIHADNDVVYPCTTPEDENTYCIPLTSCPGLIKSLATLEPSAIKYFKLSMCLGCKAGNFMVCCGQANLAKPVPKIGPSDVDTQKTLPPPANESKRDLVLRTLIPSRTFCGLQHTDDRFYNNSVAALDEFPWLVHIKFTDIYSAYKLGDRCTGVLLNNRYVLTDRICADSALKVRLGQYDVAHKVTCLQDPQAHECSEGTIEVKVDKKINLQPESTGSYALTLIRLANTVDYSDFVRPICLPLREANRPGDDDEFVFSGWGTKPATDVLEDAIKKRLVYDKTQIDACINDIPNINNYMGNKLVSLNCFAPQTTNRDSACYGDHGGPLMYMDSRHQWYVEHIIVEVAYPISVCSKNSTVVAVKITQEIIDTILNNMEA